MRTAVGYWDAQGFSLSCEAPRGCQHTFPAMPLFPNNPAPLLKDAAPAARALQTDLLSKPCSQKKPCFLSLHLPRSTNQGRCDFLMPPDSHCVFPALLHVVWKYRLNPHGCATLPFSCLNSCCTKAGGHISGERHWLSQGGMDSP